MKHVMVDLETFGTTSGCAIRSVGAAVFDPMGVDVAVPPPTFYRNVTTMSCWLANLRVDAATVSWWEKQSQEAKDKLKVDQRPLKEVVTDFNNWYYDVRPTAVWCHGAGFDTAIWEAVANAVGSPTPWKYWTVRCTRTLFEVSGFDFKGEKREGTYHGALDDALHQVKCVQAAYKKLGAARAEATYAAGSGEELTRGSAGTVTVNDGRPV